MKINYPLSEASERSILEIAEIRTNSRTLLKLMGFGLVAGKQVEVMRNRRGDVVLKSDNSRISLGESVAENIYVHETQHSLTETDQ